MVQLIIHNIRYSQLPLRSACVRHTAVYYAPTLFWPSSGFAI